MILYCGETFIVSSYCIKTTKYLKYCILQLDNYLCNIGHCDRTIFISAYVKIIIHPSIFCTRLNLFMIMERLVSIPAYITRMTYRQKNDFLSRTRFRVSRLPEDLCTDGGIWSAWRKPAGPELNRRNM